MSKTADSSEKVRWWPWFIGVILLWAVYLSVIWISDWPLQEENKGEFGDTFGALNALFAGLAFAGVIYAILLQQKELALQRKALEATEVEIRGQKEQLQAQNQTLQKQNFESSFFQLLTMHSEIVNSLAIKNIDSSGRQCFDWIIENLRPRPKMVEGDYNEVFSQYQPYVSHYFRHLYHIIKFIDDSIHFPKEFEEKKRYTDFVRAQLSNNELSLLFYLGLSDPGTEFKGLVEKYALFENIPSKVLIDEEPRKLYAPSAYGKSE